MKKAENCTKRLPQLELRIVCNDFMCPYGLGTYYLVHDEDCELTARQWVSLESSPGFNVVANSPIV